MTRITWNRSLTISLVFVALALVVIAMYIPALATALFADTLGEDPREPKIAASIDRHDEFISTDISRVNGRSLFYAPLPWPPDPTPRTVVQKDPEPKTDPEPKPDPGPPPAPPNYTGPTPNAIVGDRVWFVGGDVRVVGEEESGGVKILEIKPPWTVRIAHKGGEYDVPLFDDKGTEPFFLADPKPEKPIPGLVEAKDDADEATP